MKQESFQYPIFQNERFKPKEENPMSWPDAVVVSTALICGTVILAILMLSLTGCAIAGINNSNDKGYIFGLGGHYKNDEGAEISVLKPPEGVLQRYE